MEHQKDSSTAEGNSRYPVMYHRASHFINHIADDVYLAAMYALKLFMNLRGSKPNDAFCQLYRDVDRFGGLDRAGTSLLTVAASRLAFYHSDRYFMDYF